MDMEKGKRLEREVRGIREELKECRKDMKIMKGCPEATDWMKGKVVVVKDRRKDGGEIKGGLEKVRRWIKEKVVVAGERKEGEGERRTWKKG